MKRDGFEVITIDPGNAVLCDDCGEDYTNSDATGGIYGFTTKAICPKCAPEWIKLAKKYNEMHFLRATCPDGMTFANWVRNHLR